MKAIVDTNVIAYYLLGTPSFAEEAGIFLRSAGVLLAPASWAAELATVVWMAIREGVLPEEEGPRRLHLASRLQVRSVPVQLLWQGALGRAIQGGLAVYDTLFVELATRRGLPLVTFDRRLLQAFPTLAHRPADFPKS